MHEQREKKEREEKREYGGVEILKTLKEESVSVWQRTEDGATEPEVGACWLISAPAWLLGCCDQKNMMGITK